MVQYDYLELLKIIRDCVHKPHYRAGIFTTTTQDAKRIYADAMIAIVQDEEERSALNRRIDHSSQMFVSFNNGSFIKFISASENARGNRFHSVLYDKNIDHEILVTIIQPTEIRYMA